MSRKTKQRKRTKITKSTKSKLLCQTLYAKAVQHYQAGNIPKVEQLCCKILTKDRYHLDAHNLLAIVYGQTGQISKTVTTLQQLIQIDPSHAEAHSNLGCALNHLGRLDEAIDSFQQAIQLKPDLADAHYNAGNALKALHRLNEAEVSYRKAIQLKSDYFEAHNNLATVLDDLARPDEARDTCRQAIRIRPDFAEAHSNLGTLLRKLGRLDEAESSFRQAIRLKPSYAEAHDNLGLILNDLNRLDEAEACYRQAIQFKPNYAEAHYHLSETTTYKSGDIQIDLMEKLSSDSELTESDRIFLFFALAKASDDLGNYDKSSWYLDEGNRLRKKVLNYNIENDRKLFSKIKEIFSTERSFNISRSCNDSSIRPIFVLGMPRSGTSLVEQILATHTTVHGAGELTVLGELMVPILSKHAGKSIDSFEKESIEEDLLAVGSAYLDALFALSVPEKVVTDKMPENFRWIGWILSVFPEAKVIHLEREPLATCYSIYRRKFSTNSIGYGYDMEDLAEYYQLYLDLMSFWRKRFPDKIYDVNYESLTEHQEQETRKLLAFCELAWERQCLDFHKTQRVVRTASARQVRQELYQGSSEVWKKYEAHLQPLIKALG